MATAPRESSGASTGSSTGGISGATNSGGVSNSAAADNYSALAKWLANAQSASAAKAATPSYNNASLGYPDAGVGSQSSSGGYSGSPVVSTPQTSQSSLPYQNTINSLLSQLQGLQANQPVASGANANSKGASNSGYAIAQTKQALQKAQDQQLALLRAAQRQPIASVYAPSSQAYTDAMNAALASIDAGSTQAQNYLAGGLNTIGGDLTNNLNNISTQYGNANNALNTNYTNALNQLLTGRADSTSALNTNYTSAINALSPFTQNAGNYMDAYANQVLNPFTQSFQDYVNSPVYQFQYNQGANAITNGLAAKGLLNSGGALKALTKYGQDYAAQQYNTYNQNQIANMSNLANLGYSGVQAQSQLYQNLANALAGSNQAYDTQIGNTYTGLGNALSSNYGDMANLSSAAYMNRSNLASQLATAQAQAAAEAASARANTQYQGITGAGSGFQTLRGNQ